MYTNKETTSFLKQFSSHLWLVYTSVQKFHNYPFLLTKLEARGFPDVAPDHVVAKFIGDVVIEGALEGSTKTSVPYWMQPESRKPYCYEAFIRTENNDHFMSRLNTLVVFSRHHDSHNATHGSTYAEIRLDGEHLTAKAFQLHERPPFYYRWYTGNFPCNNHIYITLPNGVIYASELEEYQAHHRPV